MATRSDRPAVAPLALAGHPVYPALLPVPILCFTGAVLTDCAYVGSATMMWLDFSSWLLLAGLVSGGLAGTLLLLEFARAGAARRGALTLHLLLSLAAWVAALFNSFLHSRDGWTAVVPGGMILSVVAAMLSLASGLAWQRVRRAPIAVAR